MSVPLGTRLRAVSALNVSERLEVASSAKLTLLLTQLRRYGPSTGSKLIVSLA